MLFRPACSSFSETIVFHVFFCVSACCTSLLSFSPPWKLSHNGGDNPTVLLTADRKQSKSLSPTRSRKAGSSTYPGGSRSPPRRRADDSLGESQDAGPVASAARRDGSKDVGGGGAAPGVTLEQILMHNFHNNRVEGLRRTISGEKGSQVSVR